MLARLAFTACGINSVHDTFLPNALRFFPRVINIAAIPPLIRS
jgi:hypothetical protein